MTSTLTLKGNAAGAVQGINDLNKAVEQTEKKLKLSAAEARKLARDAKKVAEQADPQKKYNRQLEELARLVKQGAVSLEDAQRKAAKLGDRLQSSGRRGSAAMQKVSSQMQLLATSVIGGGGVLGAISQVNRAYELWLQNSREIVAESKKAQDEIVAFAALQAGGTKAATVERASALATRFGISDRGQAFSTVQALQSAHGGSLEAGVKAAETVFAATQVGVPVELGRELEVLGASQGQAPGEALRRAFVAGQESARDPAALARAAPALTFFDDKEFGFAVAAAISGSVKEAQVETFTKAAGVGLSSLSSAQGKFEELGLGGASRAERLQKLSDLGINTTEKVKAFGITELRQIQAIASLVPQIDQVKRIQGAIGERAVPGLFGQQRADIEAELPNQRLSRQIGILESEYRDEQAFGPRAQEALEQEILDRVRGRALQNFGKEQFLGIDLIDEEGRTGPVGEFFGRSTLNTQQNLELNEEMRKIRIAVENNNPTVITQPPRAE